ncbi:hypothetical protein AQUCO_02200343v1 [Aquilegia coerulea]|uniref:KIB1-4 beta-propeller domain-containing protein n=1 Tax=Aquilegia coerulea TaxID=218851 RepID=A0A2G5DF54_AQUCA|nr:hypothetical protein AQUCO_02200343v1 [Aquilegia coerulea]
MDQKPPPEKKEEDDDDSIQREVNWLQLPNDVLSLISNKLITIYDYIFFGAVCHPLHSIYKENRLLIPRQLPFLMITTEFNLSDNQTRSLYSITDDYFFNFQLPVPQNKIIVGSTYGWLVTTIRDNRDVSLFNPFLHFNNQIDLPELPPNDKFEAYQHCRVCKIVLSANPSSTNNYVAVAILGPPNFQLAFLKPGDKSWTCLPIHLIRDVIYFKDQFYAIDSLSRLYICDLMDSVPKITNVEPPPYFCTVELFLVESSGDLLKVCRLAKVTDDYELFVDYHKGGIRVIKLDPVTFEWIKVDDLQGRALFLGETNMRIQPTIWIEPTL